MRVAASGAGMVTGTGCSHMVDFLGKEKKDERLPPLVLTEIY